MVIYFLRDLLLQTEMAAMTPAVTAAAEKITINTFKAVFISAILRIQC